MPRVLGGQNKMVLQDYLSNCEIHLYYSMPTPAQIISYRNGGSKRVKNEIVSCLGENRLKHGIRILKGIRDGDFLKMQDGKEIPISSDSDSKDYDKDWRKLVYGQAPDLLETLAVQVFDGSSQPIQPEEETEGDGEDEDIEGKS